MSLSELIACIALSGFLYGVGHVALRIRSVNRR